MKNEFISTNKLDFGTAPFSSKIAQKPMKRFKIGTCIGLFGITQEAYEIHSLNNVEQGNGMLIDVFEWFEYAAKRDSCKVIFTNVPPRFKKHLIKKKGYTETTRNDCEKDFRSLLNR
jgi:hypothetical protein